MQPTTLQPGAQTGSQPVNGGRALAPFVYVLFFIFGGITSLNDVLIPKLKGLFNLNYGEVMLVQSAFFLSYLIVSLPAGYLVSRLGYMRSAVVGLVTMAVGALLFFPAAKLGIFAAFLGALFVVAGGITIVQVVANPLISLLGKPATAHSRLTFAQAFNSLGTTLFPLAGAFLILKSVGQAPQGLSGAALTAFRSHEADAVGLTYVGIALALMVVALVVFSRRNQLGEQRSPAPNPLSGLDLLKQPRFAVGAACIFLYVGAEVAIGSLLTNFLMQPRALDLSALAAGKLLSFYWGGAMLGRFIGTAVLRVVSPGKVLAGSSVVVIALLAAAGLGHGMGAGWTLIAVGLFNSIMFPTIFTLASEGLGVRTPEASGLLCVAIVGGAIIPPLTGATADAAGLSVALTVPAACYSVIAAYGWYARRPRQTNDPSPLDTPSVL